jgi:hypothetical protein
MLSGWGLVPRVSWEDSCRCGVWKWRGAACDPRSTCQRPYAMAEDLDPMWIGVLKKPWIWSWSWRGAEKTLNLKLSSPCSRSRGRTWQAGGLPLPNPALRLHTWGSPSVAKILHHVILQRIGDLHQQNLRCVACGLWRHAVVCPGVF